MGIQRLLHVSLIFLNRAVPFTDWLQGLSFELPELPPVNLSLPFGEKVSLHILSGNCSGATIEDVSVEVFPPDMTAFTVGFAVDGLGIACNINANTAIHRLVGDAFTAGNIDLDMSLEGSSVYVVLRVDLTRNDSAVLPQAAEVRICSATVHFKHLSFSGRSIAGRVVAGFLNGLRPFLSNPSILNDVLCAATRRFASGSVSNALRNMSAAIVQSNVLLPGKPLPARALSSSATNMRELLCTGTVGHTIQSFLQHQLHLSNTTMLLEQLSGVIGILQPRMRVPRTVNFSFGSLSGAISRPNCNTALPSALDTSHVGPHAIELSLANTSMQCSFDMSINMAFTSTRIHSKTLDVAAGLRIAVHGATVHANLLSGIDGTRAMHNYELDQLQHLGCAVHMLDTENPPSLALLDLRGGLHALGLKSWAQDADPLSSSLLRAFSLLSDGLFNTFQPTLSLFLNGHGMDLVRDRLNSLIAHEIHKVRPCPESIYTTGVYIPAEISSYVITLAFSVAGLLGMAYCFASSVGRRLRGRRTIDAIGRLLTLPMQHRLTMEDAPGSSLMAHPSISWVLAWTVSLFTLANIGLFLISSVAGQVSLIATIQDTKPEGSGPHSRALTRIMDFTMWKVVKDFYYSGCYPLMIFVVCWSVCWPIMKLVLMLACWHVPTWRLSASRRGVLLNFLAQIGKFSLFDPYLFTIFLVGFRLVWRDTDAVGGGTVAFIVEASPHIGFYVLSIGTITSLFIGEYMLQFHRKTQDAEGRFVSTVSSRHASATCTPLDRSYSERTRHSSSPSGVVVFFSSGQRGTSERPSSVQGGLGELDPVPEGNIPAFPIARSWPQSGTPQQSTWPCEDGSPSGEVQGDTRSLPQSSTPLRSTRTCEDASPPGEIQGIDNISMDVHTVLPVCALVESSRAMLALTWISVLSFLPLTLAGITASSFSFNWGGVIGAAKFLMNQPLVDAKSVVWLAFGIPFPAGSTWIQVVVTCFLIMCFTLFVVIAPLLHALSLAVFWIVPMTPKCQYRCMITSHFLHAWSALDVFVFALSVAILGGDSFGIAEFVKFIVLNGTIEPICTLLPNSFGVDCIVFSLQYLNGLFVLWAAVSAQIGAACLLRWQVHHLLRK